MRSEAGLVPASLTRQARAHKFALELVTLPRGGAVSLIDCSSVQAERTGATAQPETGTRLPRFCC